MKARPAEPDAGDACNRLVATVKELGFHGGYFTLEAEIGDEVVKVRVPRAQSGSFEPGASVLLTWTHDAARLLPAGRGGETDAGAAP